MKKINLLLLVVIFATGFSANAQIQRGNVLIGGTLANINLGLNDPSIFSADISPEVAWFVQNNFALGGYVNFGITTAENINTTTTYGVGGLTRYYLGKQDDLPRHTRIFGEATAGIGGVNVSGGDNTNGFDFSFGPGVTYFVTPNIGLELLLKYNGLAGFGSTPYQNNLNLSYGLQIYLPGRSTQRKVESDMQH